MATITADPDFDAAAVAEVLRNAMKGMPFYNTVSLQRLILKQTAGFGWCCFLGQNFRDFIKTSISGCNKAAIIQAITKITANQRAEVTVAYEGKYGKVRSD